MNSKYLDQNILIFLKQLSLDKYNSNNNRIEINYDDLIPALPNTTQEACVLLAELEDSLDFDIKVSIDKNTILNNVGRLIQLPEYIKEEELDYIEDEMSGIVFKESKSIKDFLSRSYYSACEKENRLIIIESTEFYTELEFTINVLLEIEKADYLLNKISEYLFKYLSNYDEDKLTTIDINIYSREEHMRFFLELFEDLSENNASNLIISSKELSEAISKGDNKNSKSAYKPIEFFLLLESKGYLEIKDLEFQNKDWQIIVNLIRSPKEILAIELHWTRYAGLSVNNTYKIARNNRKEATYNLKNESPAYKLIKLLVESPEEVLSYKYIEEQIYKDCRKSKSPEQRKKRIDDLVSKEIRTKLGMTEDDSRVNIIGSKEGFKLSATP